MPRNEACEKCPLHVKADNVCMAGVGHTDRPEVAFVGQAPGKDDDRAGEPFAGPAGQLLQQAIDEYKLGPAFKTHAVRCFPGRNARGKDIAPTRGQMAACSDYLAEELDEVKPKVIVAVGNHALQAMTGKTGITTWAGRVAGEFRGIPVFAMYHPRYILEMPKMLPKFEAHAKTLADTLRPSAAPLRPQVKKLSPADMREWLGKVGNRPIAFDYECSGFSPFEGHHIRTVAFSGGTVGYWMVVEGDAAARDVLKWFLLNKNIRKTAFNSVFESLWSIAEFGTEPLGLVHDPMLYAHLRNENGPHALDDLAGLDLGTSNWDIHPTMQEKGWTFETVPVEELGYYNGLDAVYTARLVQPTLGALDEGQRWVYKNILRPLAKLCARMEYRGMHIDLAWVEKALAKYRGEMDALDVEMRSDPAALKLAKGLPKGRQINWRSSQQMSRLFYDILKLPVAGTTDSGRPSAKADFLEKIKNPPTLLTKYLQWKERETVVGKYLEKFPKFCDDRDRIHQSHNPAFQVTGRISQSNPPAANVPDGVVVNGKSDGLVRGMFDSRFKGGKFVSGDYKALEFRLVVSEANEKPFIEAFKKGLDPHALTAAELFGKDFTKEDRAKAKITNFSLIYGITEYSLAPKLGVDQEAAALIIRNFKRKHPGIFVWMERQYERARREKKAVNRFGRVRHLQDIAGLPDWRVNEIYREAGNFPIQSAGADINNLSIIELDRQMRAAGMKSLVIMNHHDAIKVDAHPREVDQVRDLLVKVMQEEIPGRLDWLQVPLEVEVEVNDRWGGATWPETE